jgi:hypothetical protein
MRRKRGDPWLLPHRTQGWPLPTVTIFRRALIDLSDRRHQKANRPGRRLGIAIGCLPTLTLSALISEPRSAPKSKSDARRGRAKRGEHNRRKSSRDSNRRTQPALSTAKRCLAVRCADRLRVRRATMIAGPTAAQASFSAPYSRGALSSRSGKAG